MFKEGYLGVAETLDFRMKLMGIENTAGFSFFHKSPDKYFFLINNQLRDKLFLDELAVEPDFRDTPRLCISPANTDSLYANERIYGLYGNNVPMASKLFFFQLLSRCSGSGLGFNDDKHYVRSFTKFSNFSNPVYNKWYPLSHVLRRGNRRLSDEEYSGAIAACVTPDATSLHIRFNHINNTFVVKKLFRYFHETRALAQGVDRG